jgi:hypothetical protein
LLYAAGTRFELDVKDFDFMHVFVSETRLPLYDNCPIHDSAVAISNIIALRK